MDSSPNLAKNQFNLSRDSGLMLSDNQLYDDDTSSNEMLSDRKSGGFTRSVSHFIDRDNEKSDRYGNNVCSQSYDGFSHYEKEEPKAPPRKHKRKGEHEVSPNTEAQHPHPPHLQQSASMDTFNHYNFESSNESLKSIEDQANYVHANYRNYTKAQHQQEQLLIKSESGAHLNIYNDGQRLANLDIPQNRVRNNLVRQSSVTSTPPMSPVKYSSFSESMDSNMTDSSMGSSLFPRQYSRETDISEDSRYTPRTSVEDSSFELSNSSQVFKHSLNVPNKPQATKYYISPPSSPSEERRAAYHKKANASLRRSLPLNADAPLRTDATSKEAEDIMSSPKASFKIYASEDSLSRPKSTEPATSPPQRNAYSSNNLDSYASTNMPIKQITKYSAGLGSGSTPSHRVVMQNMQQRSSLKRDTNPVRASHDTAIVSQVRKNSVDSGTSVEYDNRLEEVQTCKVRTPSPQIVARSDSDSEINKTLTNSPRPHAPPSYDEAIERNFRMAHGIPLNISEEDEQYQKEQSARAKKLYMDSIRTYMQDHLNSPSVQKILPQVLEHRKEPVVEDSDSSDSEVEEEFSDDDQDAYVEIQHVKDPRRLFEESCRAYEQSNSNSYTTPVNKNSVQVDSKQSNVEKQTLVTLNVPSTLIHRSLSDSADRANKVGSRSPKREKSPLCQETRRASQDMTPQRRGCSPINSASRLSYSSSSVSNSSSDTVTESQTSSYSGHSGRDRSESSPVISRHAFRQADSHSPVFAQKSSAQVRNISPVAQIRAMPQISRETPLETRHSTPKESSERTVSKDLSKLNISSVSSIPQNTPISNTRTSSGHVGVPRASSTGPAQPRQIIARRHEATRDSKEQLPWSVKDLRNKYAITTRSSLDSVDARPSPPPYQNPPPFRRHNDNTRTSTSSNSSSGSAVGRGTPTRPLSVHTRYGGGPQARESSSSEDSDSCKYSDRQYTFCSSSEEISWTDNNLTDVTYV